MEYLYMLNPIFRKKRTIIIYGIGPREKGIFYALLQQNIYVTAFCLKEGQDSRLEKIFNKKIITFHQLQEEYRDAYVIISGGTSASDGEVLKRAGINNLIIENITLKEDGILFLGE